LFLANFLDGFFLNSGCLKLFKSLELNFFSSELPVDVLNLLLIMADDVGIRWHGDTLRLSDGWNRKGILLDSVLVQGGTLLEVLRRVGEHLNGLCFEPSSQITFNLRVHIFKLAEN